MTEHDEHYESIPWDSLVTDDARRRRRWIYLGVGLVLAVAVGAAVGRSLVNGRPTPSAPSAGATTTTTEIGRTTTSGLAAPDPTSRVGVAVMAHAAWFVADYFTIDGSDVTRESVLDRLPAGTDVPEPDASARSFVESVFPTTVEPLGPEVFRVVSVVRTLAAADGSSYRRQPPRAVEVLVGFTDEGPAILDLPRPVPLDTARSPGMAVDALLAPDEVMAAAEADARIWGTLVGDPISGKVGDTWRVVQMVEDAEGLTWPIASWFDQAGRRVAPWP